MHIWRIENGVGGVLRGWYSEMRPHTQYERISINISVQQDRAIRATALETEPTYSRAFIDLNYLWYGYLPNPRRWVAGGRPYWKHDVYPRCGAALFPPRRLRLVRLVASDFPEPLSDRKECVCWYKMIGLRVIQAPMQAQSACL